MLHNALASYLEAIESEILAIDDIYVERYVEDILTPQRANLRIRMRFSEGHLLEIHEAMMVENGKIISLDYRYHCQDKRNYLIFRYDSTPHFPELLTFPHHKHLPNEVIASEKPEISQVLKEAKNSG